MPEVAKIEGRVRYSSFKKTVKVIITPTDSLDDLKAQHKLTLIFSILVKINIHVTYLLMENKDEYAWKTASYMP